MRYSVNTNCLRKEHSIKEIVAICKDVGVDGIEWGLPELEEAREAIEQMHKRTLDSGLEVVGYLNCGKCWKIDEMKRWTDILASVDAKFARVEHPWVAYSFDESLHQKDSWWDIFKLAREALPFLAKLSEESGVRFVFETHGGALTASTLAAIKLLEGFSPKNFGIIYDPTNNIIEGNMRPRSDVEVLGDYLAYVHAKNCVPYFDRELIDYNVKRSYWRYKVCSPSVGMLDWVEVFFALKLAGYDGWISSEEYFPLAPTEILKQEIAFLKRCEEYAPKETEEPFTNFNE